MRYIEALEVYEPKPGETSLFLAGGIDGAPDWQQKYRAMFEGTDIVLLNPRRHEDNWSEEEGQRQVNWEYQHLRKATAISFWFPAEAVCAMSMYELGAWSMTSKPLFVGVHPTFWKRRGVRHQSFLVRPDIRIVETLEELAAQVKGKLLGIKPVPVAMSVPEKRERNLVEVALKMRPILSTHKHEMSEDPELSGFDDIVSSAGMAAPEMQQHWWAEMTDWLESNMPEPTDCPVGEFAWVRELVAIFNGR